MVARRSTRSRHADERVPDLEEDVDMEEEDVELDVDDDDDDKLEEVTRCICGEPELQLSANHPDYDQVDTGFFIQCEECQVWQHGYCVGIKDEADAPDKYWCELCKPELHTLVYKGPKDKRSLYTPVTEKRRKPARKVKEEKEVKKEEYGESVAGGSADTKSSSSPHSTGGAVSAVTAATTGAGADEDDEDDEENGAKGGSAASSATTNGGASATASATASALSSASTAATSAHNSSELANSLPASAHDSRHRRERSRGTLNSRDAEYELMLKRALEESAKESGVQPEDPELSEYTRERASRRRTRLLEDVKKEEDVDLDKSEHDRRSHSTTKDVENAAEYPEKKKRRVNDGVDGHDAAGNVSGDGRKHVDHQLGSVLASHGASAHTDGSENDSSVPRAAASKKKRPRRAAALSAKQENVNTTPKRARSKEEIDADKPTKPRLPQQRISMYEMRKRTSAILEFLVRTQTELKEDFESGTDITEFMDENSKDSDLSKDEIKNTLAAGYNESVTLMESLTRKIIDWNTKYGESSA